ncbi:AraC family transcriptional regulator [Lactiplantibacillus plajomi]|uniref:AraC family transcriptional regulator n=1 Tax=Lactiplantibacillus plajomi TaxID=1457217 RepID=A0ABV6K623_9LACO|nr:AraC family transcriptional regulator [Lactiplantibacillus plajomi]
MAIIFNNGTANLPLRFYDIGTDWDQHKVYRPNGFDYFHWLQTDTGTGILSIGNQQIKLGPGQGFLMRPNIPHSFFPDSSLTAWKTSFLTFEGVAAEDMVTFLNLNDFQIYDQLDEPLAHYLQQKFPIFYKTDLAATFQQSSAIYNFLLLLRHNAITKQLNFTANTVPNAIMTYIRKNYQRTITNEELSKLAGYSVTHTTKIFRDETGQTPLEYLTDFRLRMAKSLLTFNDDLTIKQVATNVGFANSSYFVQQFKQYFGMTPGQLRKQIQL